MLLVTGTTEQRMRTWLDTSHYVCWVGRDQPGLRGRKFETWQAMVFQDSLDAFLSTARRHGVVVVEDTDAADEGEETHHGADPSV